MFQPDFAQIIFNLLPHFLRTTKMQEWLNSLFAPLVTINTFFNSARNNVLYKLQFTGQVNYLERVLNDRFDPIGLGIFISNANQPDREYIFNTVELREDTFLFNTAEAGADTYFYQQQEFDDAIDFTINIPVAVPFNTPDLDVIVNRYRKAGTQYNVVTF